MWCGMAELYLIRHGESCRSSGEHYSEEKRTMDPPLTPAGMEQARQLAERLQGVHFDRIYSSDLDRASQTARILGASVNAEVVIKEGLREIDMGELWRKRPWSDFPELHAKWVLHEEDIPYPGGENGGDVWCRCKPLIDEIVLTDRRAAIVCHGGTIRAMVCGMLDIPQQKRFYLGLPPVNCSISIVVHREERFFLHSFNDGAHITG